MIHIQTAENPVETPQQSHYLPRASRVKIVFIQHPVSAFQQFKQCGICPGNIQVIGDTILKSFLCGAQQHLHGGSITTRCHSPFQPAYQFIHAP